MNTQPSTQPPFPEPEEIVWEFLLFRSPATFPSTVAMASDVVDYTFHKYWSAYICQRQRSPLLAKLSDGGRRGYGDAEIVEGGNSIAKILDRPIGNPITARTCLSECLFPVYFRQLELDQDYSPVALLAVKRALGMMEDACSFFSRSLFSYGLEFNGKGIVGLQGLVQDIGLGTTMGIDSDEFPFWKNQVINLNSNGAKFSPASLLYEMKRMSRKIAKAHGMTDIIVTTRDLHTAYELTLPNWKHTHRSSVELGCRSLDFEDTGVIWDEFCPEGRMYFLNSKTLNLRSSGRTNMTILDSKPRFDLNRMTWVVEIWWIGQTFMTNRQSQGVIIV